MKNSFKKRLRKLEKKYSEKILLKNKVKESSNGIYQRYQNPVLTADHIPLNWRYDLNEKFNPHLIERIGINAVFNAGAIKFNGKYLLIARVEGNDRKSFFCNSRK